MAVRSALVAAAVAANCAATDPAYATFTTVNISAYLNGNLSTNDQMDPLGLTTGNTGTGIPFQTYEFGPESYMGSAFLAGRSAPPDAPATLSIALNSFNISGQASFYALLNNYYGTPNANEYTVTINFVGGASESYASIGGKDTRDYNENLGTDNTIDGTTSNWWTNEAVLGPSGYQRLDVREFGIDPQYQNDTIASFQIIQVNSNDPAFLSGLTFSTNAPQSLVPGATPVPEPVSLGLLGTGIAGLLLMRRRRG